MSVSALNKFILPENCITNDNISKLIHVNCGAGSEKHAKSKGFHFYNFKYKFIIIIIIRFNKIIKMIINELGNELPKN